LELRGYVGVLQRRWPIIVLTTTLVALVALALTLRGPRSYESSVRLAVSVFADNSADAAPYGYFRDYYAWLASEYLADDLSEVIRSDAFATDVATYLNEEVSKATFKDVVRPRKTHRVLEVTVQAGNVDSAQRIAAAVADVLRAKGPSYLAELRQGGAQIVSIDTPIGRAATTTPSQLMDIGLRVAFGLLFGLFVAFLVDYLDTRFRTVREVESVLGVPVLAEIPRYSH
jgi:capsular polysaccharide biosynthesis protein